MLVFWLLPSQHLQNGQEVRTVLLGRFSSQPVYKWTLLLWGYINKTKTTVFTRCASTPTVRTPHLLPCSYPSLFSSSSQPCRLWLTDLRGRLLRGQTWPKASVWAAALSLTCQTCSTLLPRTGLSTATPSMWALDANYCPTSLILPSCPAHILIL